MRHAVQVDLGGSSSVDRSEDSVLVVDGLRVYYDTPRGPLKAVDGVSFRLRRGERLALVGESGSGKSTLAMALMRMTKPPGRVVSGSVILDGRDLLMLDREGIRGARLTEIALIPQGAMNSLNPVIRVENQILDGIQDHLTDGRKGKAALRPRVHELLRRVGLTPSVARMFPHELSGGMKQRVAMAIATCLDPKVIIADEPTSALDVVVQRQIMQTLGRVQEGLHASTLLVGHDMGLVAQFADVIGVMYAGKIVELGPVGRVFEDPLHPYTKLLIKSLPSFRHKADFVGIPGLPPRLLNLPSGCSFHPRCPSVMDRCKVITPTLREVRGDRQVSCHLFEEVAQ